jgi:molybdenum cofactor cytidylyltransferase
MIQEIPTAGVILAAGESKRFGQPKQLLRFKDRYLIEWVLDAALESKLNQVVVVLGHAHDKILQALDQKLQHAKILIEINRGFKAGQSASLRAGLSKVKDDFAAVMFLLADQPMLNSEIINSLLESFWGASKDICVPTYKGKRKNPTLFRHRLYRQLMDLKGDIGARQLIENNPDHVLSVEIDNPLCFLDIDTHQDIEILNQQLEKNT